MNSQTPINNKHQPYSYNLLTYLIISIIVVGITYCLVDYYSSSSIASFNENETRTYEQSDYSEFDFIAHDSTFYLKYPEETKIDEKGFITVNGTKFDAKKIRKISLLGVGLNNREFSDFPVEVLKFENLEYLYLGMRGFKRVPEEIVELKHLKVLDLQHCAVEELPSNLSELRQLEELILLYTNIKQLPDDIDKLIRLKRLHLGCTNFDEIPTQLFKMNGLQSLILTNRRECGGDSQYGFYKEKEKRGLKAMLPNTNVYFRERSSSN